jgi:hypothetical protein
MRNFTCYCLTPPSKVGIGMANNSKPVKREEKKIFLGRNLKLINLANSPFFIFLKLNIPYFSAASRCVFSFIKFATSSMLFENFLSIFLNFSFDSAFASSLSSNCFNNLSSKSIAWLIAAFLKLNIL